MSLSLGVVMDPIDSLNFHKDSTLAMLLAAQGRGWATYYMQPGDIELRDGEVAAHCQPVTIYNDPKQWYELGERERRPLDSFDVILMRKDPPFDMEYIYTTYLLELAERRGTLVVNRCQSLRDANEKLFTAWFPHCTPPTLVSRNALSLKEFIHEHREVVVKPLGGMGGASIFKLVEGDANINVILETITQHGSHFCMAQRFIPEITAGDKRILLIDGEPVPYALARKPTAGEFRGNLAAGGRGEGVALSERDRWICDQVGETLREKGLIFVGIDVIGDYLTEINVTSPTCIRELDKQYGLDIAGDLMTAIERRLQARAAG